MEATVKPHQRKLNMKTQIIKLGGCLLIAAAVLCGGQALANPPTPVTCGSVITAPGEYYLASDCAGQGITISASNVYLKLNGHTMDGGPGGFIGLDVLPAGPSVSQVHIEGPGTITHYQYGIVFDLVSDSHVEQVTSVGNQLFGFLLLQMSTNNHVNNSVFSGNGAGLRLGSGCTDNHVNNNEADSNDFGISVSVRSTSNQINGNTALGNRIFDLDDDNPGCDDNRWKGNKFVTANQPCID